MSALGFSSVSYYLDPGNPVGRGMSLVSWTGSSWPFSTSSGRARRGTRVSGGVSVDGPLGDVAARSRESAGGRSGRDRDAGNRPDPEESDGRRPDAG